MTSPGNVDVVWYGTSATGEPNGFCGTVVSQSPCTDSSGKPDGLPLYTDPKAPAWNVYLAQSTNALSASRTFKQVVVNPTPTHYGDASADEYAEINPARSTPVRPSLIGL